MKLLNHIVKILLLTTCICTYKLLNAAKPTIKNSRSILTLDESLAKLQLDEKEIIVGDSDNDISFGKNDPVDFFKTMQQCPTATLFDAKELSQYFEKGELKEKIAFKYVKRIVYVCEKIFPDYNASFCIKLLRKIGFFEKTNPDDCNITPESFWDALKDCPQSSLFNAKKLSQELIKKDIKQINYKHIKQLVKIFEDILSKEEINFSHNNAEKTEQEFRINMLTVKKSLLSLLKEHYLKNNVDQVKKIEKISENLFRQNAINDADKNSHEAKNRLKKSLELIQSLIQENIKHKNMDNANKLIEILKILKKIQFSDFDLGSVDFLK